MRNWNMVCHGDCFMTWELEEIDVLAALAFAFLLIRATLYKSESPKTWGFIYFLGGWGEKAVL